MAARLKSRLVAPYFVTIGSRRVFAPVAPGAKTSLPPIFPRLGRRFAFLTGLLARNFPPAAAPRGAGPPVFTRRRMERLAPSRADPHPAWFHRIFSFDRKIASLHTRRGLGTASFRSGLSRTTSLPGSDPPPRPAVRDVQKTRRFDKGLSPNTCTTFMLHRRATVFAPTARRKNVFASPLLA